MPTAFYRCDKCHREHNSREEALRCELAHLVPVSVSVKSYSIRSHPYSLEVTFSDGKARIYNAEDLGG